MIIQLSFPLLISIAILQIGQSRALSTQEPSQSKDPFGPSEPGSFVPDGLSSLLSQCISSASIDCLRDYDASTLGNRFFVDQNEDDEDEIDHDTEGNDDHEDDEYDEDEDNDEDSEDDEDKEDDQEDEDDAIDGADEDGEDNWDNDDY